MATTLPTASHVITTFDAQGRSVFHDATNPPPILREAPNSRIDYIYSTPGSSNGPPLAGDEDLKAHQAQLAAATPSYVMFPTVGGTAAMVINFGPNPTGKEGTMHRTRTIDYLFVIDGELELTLDSGEKRVLKKGDVVVQRQTVHAWKNLSKTEFARMGAVCVGVEGAVLNEMITGEEK